jgi:hypothetical protein
LTETEDGDGVRRLLGFADPCTSDQFPGWPLRNLLVLVASKFGRRRLGSAPLQVICLRQKSLPGGKISIENSIFVEVHLNGAESSTCDEPLITGDHFKIKIIITFS